MNKTIWTILAVVGALGLAGAFAFSYSGPGWSLSCTGSVAPQAPDAVSAPANPEVVEPLPEGTPEAEPVQATPPDAQQTPDEAAPPVPLVWRIVSALPLVGCTPQQIRAWTAFGAEVAGCLLGRCQLGEGVVRGLQSGAWGTIAADSLGCATGCMGTAIMGTLELERGEDRQTASWFGTSNEVRVEPVYRVRIAPPK